MLMPRKACEASSIMAGSMTVNIDDIGVCGESEEADDGESRDADV